MHTPGLRLGAFVAAVAIGGAIIGNHGLGVAGVRGVNANDSLSRSEYHRDSVVVGEEGIGGIGARGDEELENKNKVWTLEEIYEELQVHATLLPPHFSSLLFSPPYSPRTFTYTQTATFHFHLLIPQNHRSAP